MFGKVESDLIQPIDTQPVGFSSAGGDFDPFGLDS